MLVAAMILLGAVIAGGGPEKLAGKAAGTYAGGKVARVLPAPKAKPVTDPKGGRFCRVLDAMGGPILLLPEDRISDPTLRRIVNIDEHGEKHCGWKGR